MAKSPRKTRLFRIWANDVYGITLGSPFETLTPTANAIFGVIGAGQNGIGSAEPKREKWTGIHMLPTASTAVASWAAVPCSTRSTTSLAGGSTTGRLIR